MKTLYVFGNEYLKGDGFAKQVAKYLNGTVNIADCTTPEDLFYAKEKEILILDVVRNIKNPLIIKDTSQIKTKKIISLHDFDLGFFLKLMREINNNKKIKIIGVPPRGNAAKIAKEVQSLI